MKKLNTRDDEEENESIPYFGSHGRKRHGKPELLVESRIERVTAGGFAGGHFRPNRRLVAHLLVLL